MELDWRHRTALAVLCLQLMLVYHTYRSTDFEVHRNWLAITYHLPISKWYYEATSEWTLDYPPLFAWFEWILAQFARYLDPQMLIVSNLDYASNATVLFQRLSVCATSLVLISAMLRATQGSKCSAKGWVAFFLVVANAGLIMVDNIHFQYNSVLLGLLVWSILMLEEQQCILSGMLFAVLLNMKHLFAYLGPVYFAFMLKHYVLDATSGSSKAGSDSSSSSCRGALRRLVMLGGAVLVVFAVSFGPFIALGQARQVLSRLFPFARGLCHAYWAPNAWALYSFADKVLAAGATVAGLKQPSATANMAGGIVGISSFVILPNIGAGVCALLTLIAMLPCLVALWRAPKADAARLFAGAIAYANLCGFMFGYHVHEKAVLTVEIPMVLIAIRNADWGKQYVLFSTAAHVGIFPLLFQVQEVPVRWLLAVVYYIISIWGLSQVHGSQMQHQQHADASNSTPATQQQQQQHHSSSEALQQPEPGFPMMWQCCSWLPLLYRFYLAGFVVLELYCALGHRVLLGDRLPFVPLMLTSVYCAMGISWVWAWMAWWFVRRCRV